jgi:GDPmannose 4,6-dehydratase
VIATGENSVREFCQVAFGHVGLDSNQWIKIDPKLVRPAAVEALTGDCSQARPVLGWKHRVFRKDLIIEMVESDMEYAERVLRGGTLVEFAQESSLTDSPPRLTGS